MPSSLGSHHGHSMDFHWCFSLGGFYGNLPCLAHWDLTIALVLLIGGEVDGGIHGILPCLAHWDITMAILWNCIGASHWENSMDFFHA